MTTELQTVLARYEDARIEYKKAVLASLHGESGGEEIRRSIRAFQDASAALRRMTGRSTPPPRVAVREAKPPTANGFAFFRRLLDVG